MNIATILDMAAEVCGERCGIATATHRYRYAELRERAQAAAAYLRAGEAGRRAMGCIKHGVTGYIIDIGAGCDADAADGRR